jgi:hypothetical protein
MLIEMGTEAGYRFLQMWHSCTRMVWDRYPESVFMVNGDDVLFEQDWKNGYLLCGWAKVWSVFESDFGYDGQQIRKMISGLLEEHLENGGLTPLSLMEYFSQEPGGKNISKKLTPCNDRLRKYLLLEEHLKKGGLTPMCASIFIETGWKSISKTGV